jgi:hypothetical protein
LMTIQDIHLFIIFFLKTKAFVMFEVYKALVEKQNDWVIKVLHIDHWGEYIPFHLKHLVLLKGYCTNL